MKNWRPAERPCPTKRSPPFAAGMESGKRQSCLQAVTTLNPASNRKLTITRLIRRTP